VWKENQRIVAQDNLLEEVQQQAERLEKPVHFIKTDFASYEENFTYHLQKIKQKFTFTHFAFGDIYLQGHRDWGERVAKNARVIPVYPLWNKQDNMLKMLRDFVNLGFKAKIINVDEEKLSKNWLGRPIDHAFIEAIANKAVCPMGESGEYHTFVYDGPIFP